MFDLKSKFGASFGFFIAVNLAAFHLTVSDTRYECISGGYGGRFGDDYEGDEMGRRLWTSGTLTCPQADRGNIVVLRVGYGTSMIPGRCESDTLCKEEYDTGDVIADRCDGRSSCFIGMMPRYMNCGRMSNYMMVEYECIDSWRTFEVCENVSTVSRGASIFITSPSYLSFRPPAATRGTQMCECIIQSQDSADLFLDYLQTQLTKTGNSCPYEYVLLESKADLNQSSIDKEMEVCGRRHIGSKWFSGSVRLTYASGGPMPRNGLIAKFTVDNIGNSPNIEIECGTVDASGMKLKDPPPALSETRDPSVIRTRIPRDPYLDPRPPPPFSPLGPSRNLRGDFESFLRFSEMDDGPFDDAAERMLQMPNSPLLNGLPPRNRDPLPPRNRAPVPRSREPAPRSREPAPRNRVDSNPPPDFRNWRINVPDTPAPGLAINTAVKPAPVETNPPVKSPPPRRKSVASVPIRNQPPKQNPKQTPRQNQKKVNPTSPVEKPRPGNGPRQRLGNGVFRQPIQNRGRSPTKGKGAKKVVDEKPAISENSPVAKSDSGSLVALVIAGVGAVLIVGSFGIIAFHNYRKRQRIKAEEAEYAISGGSTSSTYGQGWTSADESVYATIADVDKFRNGCVNPALSQELDLHPSDIPMDTFVGQQEAVEDADQILNPGNTAPNQSAIATQDTKCPSTEIAIIDVHQSFEDSTEMEQHNEQCLPSCEYSAVNRESNDANACSACSITRPPRRKDVNRGYDNNIGVKGKGK